MGQLLQERHPQADSSTWAGDKVSRGGRQAVGSGEMRSSWGCSSLQKRIDSEGTATTFGS